MDLRWSWALPKQAEKQPRSLPFTIPQGSLCSRLSKSVLILDHEQLSSLGL